jgi:hypothetical protein
VSFRKFNNNGRLEKTISTLLHRKHARSETGFCLLGFPLRWLEPALPILHYRTIGNSKKGTSVEEKVVFTGNQQDFEQFRTWFHDHSSSSRVSRAEGEGEEWVRGV